MRVFVTDGDNRAALAVTRSLGRKGHEVIVGDRHSRSLAGSSRYCSERVVYPDPITASDAFVEFLAKLTADRRVEVIVPVADITTMLLTAHRGCFDPSCAIPFAPAAVVAAAANKVALVDTARRLGVPVPTSVVVNGPSDIPTLPFGFPLVIKPHQSRLRLGSGWVSTGVSYASSPEELRRDLESRPPHEFPVMLQERITGPGLGVFALYHEGRPAALFSHRRVRERPPWGGVSVLSESVELDPRACEYAVRLLDELRWEGVAMVEFKGDDRDGVPKLMEINGRFWGSLQLAIDSGVDFPALLVQSVHPGDLGSQPPYRIGVRSRWLWGDFDSLLLTLFGRNRRGAIPKSGLGAIRDFMTFLGRGLYYDNPKPDDVRPWLFETYRRFRPARKNSKALAAAKDTAQDAAAKAHSPVLQFGGRARIHTRLEDVPLDAGSWNALAARSETSSVFQTREWAESWLATLGRNYEPLFITLAGVSGVTALAPLVLESRPLRERVVRFVGDGRADYCDILTSGDKPRALQTIFTALRGSNDWDVLELNNIPSHSRTPTLLRAMCKAAGLHYLLDDQYVCPTLLIQGHEESVREIYNKQSLRRRQNYFERHGRLVIRDLTGAREIEPYLDAFFAQHTERWGMTSSPSLFVDAANREFYRHLTGTLGDTGLLLFSVVEFDGQPIAFHFGFDYNGTVMWYKPSFDVAHSAHSPGMVMVRHLIGYALDRKRRELDFTVGDEEFKRRFTNATRKTCQFRAFREPAKYLFERSKRTIVTTVRHLAR